jgi:hypothetical protein
MKINSAEHIQESIVEQLRREKKHQDEMKILTRKSILRIIGRVKGSKLSYEIRKQIEGIQEFETLEAILGEIWSVKDIGKIVEIINKYDWLQEMKRLDVE